MCASRCGGGVMWPLWPGWKEEEIVEVDAVQYCNMRTWSLLKTRFTLDRVGYRISFVFFFLFADDVIRRVLRSACFPLHLRNAFDSSEEEQKRNKQINAEDEVVSIWLYHRQICFPFDVSSPFCLGFVVEQSFYFTVSFISISRKEAEVKQK